MKPVAQILRSTMLRPALAVALAAFGFALTATLQAMPVVSTLSGGPYNGNPNSYYGYTDGDTFFVAQFHTPYGLALDSTGNNLFVADRDNNAVRQLDIPGNLTSTFVPNTYVPANLISKPVGVAVNGGNVFVLNRGNGINGTVLQFDSTYAELIATNATALTNAAGITVDAIGNLYLTVQSNTVIQINPAGVRSVIATITNIGTSLQGLTVKHSGLLAVCDSGRNGIYLIDPGTGNVTTNAGFHGAGDFGITNRNSDSSANVKFNQPYGVAVAGDDTLIVTDNGNHRVKLVLPSGVVTNLYGVRSTFWGNGPGYPAYAYPGWADGTVIVPDYFGGVEARQPAGVAFAPDGSVYVTEDYYHVIRHVTSTGLALPPPPPLPVPAPTIGWVSFVGSPTPLSVLVTGSSFVFNNDAIIAIKPGTNGSQVFYTSGQTPLVGSIPDPSPTNGTTPPTYADGLPTVSDLGVTRYPDMLIKAIGTKNDGSPSSSIVQARLQFITANPLISGGNAAQFTITDETVGAQMWYTLDGTDPTNGLPSIGPIFSGATLSLNVITNTTFKIRAYRAKYQPSGVANTLFTPANFIPNSISFGFAYGEASSDFVASPGQLFYAPVTLSILPNVAMYSLQFNINVTNVNSSPAVFPGGFFFESFLVKPDPQHPGIVLTIPPAMYLGISSNQVLVTNIVDVTNTVVVTNYVTVPGFSNPPPTNQIIYPWYYDRTSPFLDLEFVNTAANLLGVGWLERKSGIGTNLYDTTSQDLIKYSKPHDTLFDESGGKVVVGGYAFLVPGTAVSGQQYQISIGRPSATSDGIGMPGSDVYIETPTNRTVIGGTISALKNVTVGQRKYLVGDVYPFRWFNAGDFGKTNLVSADVMQVFQSVIYSWNYPPFGSDFFDGMDSCCGTGAASPGGYWQPTGSASQNALFDGNDTSINTVAFGDNVLDVSDVYVTFRRSLDPSLSWFERFWTNGVRGALPIANSNGVALLSVKSATLTPTPIFGKGGSTPVSNVTNATTPAVTFTAGDGVTGPGQSLLIPITAQIFGNYPLRVLMLNLTVTPLDGSPALTTAIQFTPAGALGTPALVTSQGLNNYAAAWLNSTIAGLTGSATIGMLQIKLPTNAPASSSYSIHFDHASASPNGLASFPKKTFNGLITLSDRSASSWNDGIPDSWRLRWFGTIYNQLSARTADADGDGANNWNEYNAGTDPNDSTSVLRVNAQGLTVHWPSVANRTYVVEKSASLFGGTWTSIVTNTGTGTDMQYQDNSGGARFYRVRVSP